MPPGKNLDVNLSVAEKRKGVRSCNNTYLPNNALNTDAQRTRTGWRHVKAHELPTWLRLLHLPYIS